MRWWRMALVALLIVVGAGLAPGRVPGAAAIGVSTPPAAPPDGPGLDTGRLTVLPDGRVLLTRLRLIGQEMRGIAGLYGPAGGNWVTIPAPDAWAGYAAPVVLRDGRVFIAGGSTGSPSQIYDLTRDLWTLDAPAPTYGGVATTLRDGRILLVGSGGAALYSTASADRTCFPETGKCIADQFLAYWQSRAGLAINGYPISDERIERLEDGKEYTVQYFERVRLEYHPENAAPYDVLLGQFGRRILNGEFGVPRLPEETSTVRRE